MWPSSSPGKMKCTHRRYCLVPHSAPRYSVFTDKEAQQAQVHVTFKHEALPCATPRHYRRALTEDIFQTALNKRFFRISRQRGPPFYAAEVPATSHLSSSPPVRPVWVSHCIKAMLSPKRTFLKLLQIASRHYVLSRTDITLMPLSDWHPI